MKASDKPTWWKSRLFGAAYERDERIKLAVDRAGNYSFCVLMFVLYVCATVGLLLKQPDLYIITGIFFLCGCIIYLFFMVKTSAFYIDLRGKVGRKNYRGFVAMAVTFVVLDFGVRYFSIDDGTTPNFLSLFTQSLLKSLLWIGLVVLLIKMLTSITNRRIDKKINKE